MSKWKTIDPGIPQYLPEKPACYVVILRGRAIYVGMTINLRKRFRQHGFRWGYTDEIKTPWTPRLVPAAALVVKVRYSERYGDWAMRELRLIKRLQPVENCMGSVKKRAVAA